MIWKWNRWDWMATACLVVVLGAWDVPNRSTFEILLGMAALILVRVLDHLSDREKEK